MAIEDRLGADGSPRVALGEDTGDFPIMTAARSGPITRPARTASTYREGQPLSSGPFAPQDRVLGSITISDVISPKRFRRVSQPVRIRRNDLYRGPIKVIFETHVSAMISEELGALAPSPRPTQTPSRTQAATTHSGGRITRHGGNSNAPPRRSSQKISAQDMPFNSAAADRYGAWETLGGQAGNSVDFENISDALNGEGTDSTLEQLGEVVRPRSWTRHTILQIRFRYPLMEPMLPASSWNSDAIPFGDSLVEMERNADLQNTVTEFTLMAGSSHIIEIPYPVGSTVPVHFDIINHNPLYAANVNMSATVYVSKE
ncbi:MAG: hypothetical protein HWE35_17850 [Rhodobacteraceae bacterium]|nr:hypothetical protein [Paracoccaceae bacterium]